jgi:hypothetical protein
MKIEIEETQSTIVIAEKKLGYSLTIDRASGALKNFTEPEFCNGDDKNLFFKEVKAAYNKYRHAAYIDTTIDEYVN